MFSPDNGFFQPHYDNYNKRYGTDGIHVPLDWSEYQVRKYSRKCCVSTPNLPIGVPQMEKYVGVCKFN